jgi:hypothetical protein
MAREKLTFAVDMKEEDYPQQWVIIASGCSRLDVPGGWLYRVDKYGSTVVAFVPKPAEPKDPFAFGASLPPGTIMEPVPREASEFRTGDRVTINDEWSPYRGKAGVVSIVGPEFVYVNDNANTRLLGVFTPKQLEREGA